MLKIRVVKIEFKARAVQAVLWYHNNKRVIVKHFGLCHSDEELEEMLYFAMEWIKDYMGQTSIFPEDNPNMTLRLYQYVFLGIHYKFFYNLVQSIQKEIGLETLTHPLLSDLVKIRIFEPTSKLCFIDLLEECFGVKHQPEELLSCSLWLA